MRALLTTPNARFEAFRLLMVFPEVFTSPEMFDAWMLLRVLP